MNNILRLSDKLVSKHTRMGNFTFKGKTICLALAWSFVLGSLPTFAQTKAKPNQAEAEKLINSANAISFIENKGQWPSGILFHVDVPGGQMSVTPEGMLMGQYDASSFAAVEAYDMKREQAMAKGKSTKDLGPAPYIKGHAWRFNFIGGSKATPETIEKGGQSNEYFNFLGFNGKDVSTAFGYNRIIYKNVYKNIDVKYYTSASGALENDVIVKPGADGKQVRIAIDGIENLRMNDKGELVLPTSVGDITVTRPISYLLDTAGNRTDIDVKYVLTGKNTLSFNIPAYDKTKTLVIDPIVMRWATWVTNNSSADGHNHGIDVDASGYIYVTGKAAQNLIVTAGAFQASDSGSFNVFVGKYQEPATPGQPGVRVWQTYFGSTSTDIPYVLTIGVDGYLYIAGTTSGNLHENYGTGFAAGTWTQRICNDVIHQQAFIAKVSPAGTGALVREIGPANLDCEPALFDVRTLSTGGSNFDLVAVG